MLWKILPLQKKNYLKFKTACQEVVADKIFEEHIIQNTTGTYKLLSFKNTLLQEIASNLWLDSQRQNLHLSCAKYLENQLHLMQANRPYDIAIGIPSPSKHHITPVSSVIPSQTDLSGAKKIEKSVVTDSNMTDTSSIMSLTKILENSDRKSIACHQNMFNSEQKHEISHHSHYKRHFVVSLHEPILRFDLDSQGFFVRKEINVKRMENCFSVPSDLKSHLKNEDSSIRKSTTKNGKRIGNSDLISKLWSMHSDYNPKEKPFINNQHLFQRYSQIEPAEIEVLSKIYTQLAYQYREAKDVRSTLTYLIKSAEALSTFNFPYVALEYICDAGHIVAQLVNGIDPLNDAVVNDDDEDAKKTKVYAPSLNEIALVNIVLGQVYMQIDEIDASLRAFLTALRMLNVNVLQDTNFGNKLKKICSRENIPNNYQKNWNCFGGRKKDLQNIFLVERCLNFVFHIIHDFDIEVALSEHQSIQKTNAIVQKQVQFAEMLNSVGDDDAVFDILSAQACAYLNQFQLSMLTTNDVLADESLQKLLTVIEKIDAASKLSVQNEQSNSLKHSLIHHILVCLATVSVNKKNALNAEIVVKLAMDSAKRINNRNSIGVLMTLLAQVYIMKDEKQNFKELMDGIYRAYVI